MRLQTLACNVMVIQERLEDQDKLHTADQVFHNMKNQLKCRRESRKNHKDMRTICYIFNNIADAQNFEKILIEAFSAK